MTTEQIEQVLKMHIFMDRSGICDCCAMGHDTAAHAIVDRHLKEVADLKKEVERLKAELHLPEDVREFLRQLRIAEHPLIRQEAYELLKKYRHLPTTQPQGGEQKR